MGSTFAALTAGYNPKMMPMQALIKSGNRILHGVMTVGIPTI